jgi:hypothetical protein
VERTGKEVTDDVVGIQKQFASDQRRGFLAPSLVTKALGPAEDLRARRQPSLAPHRVPDPCEHHDGRLKTFKFFATLAGFDDD